MPALIPPTSSHCESAKRGTLTHCNARFGKKQMRVIAFIENLDVVEKIPRHMKLWGRPKAC